MRLKDNFQEPRLEPYQVTVSITMSKTMTVYKEDPCFVDCAEGKVTLVSTRQKINEADVRLQHTLPDELLAKQEDEDFKGWHVDELEVVED